MPCTQCWWVDGKEVCSQDCKKFPQNNSPKQSWEKLVKYGLAAVAAMALFLACSCAQPYPNDTNQSLYCKGYCPSNCEKIHLSQNYNTQPVKQLPANTQYTYITPPWQK